MSTDTRLDREGAPTRIEAERDALTDFSSKASAGIPSDDPWAQAVDNGRFVYGDDDIIFG